MRKINLRCIVLGTRPLGESDKLVYLYNDEIGKIKVVAKGSRKINSRFNGHLEIMNSCIVTLYYGPKNIILVDSTPENKKNTLKKNLHIAGSIVKIAEITNHLLYENQNLEGLNALLEKTIEHLATATPEHSQKNFIIEIGYIVKLLDKFGIIPELKGFIPRTNNKYLKLLNFLKEKDFVDFPRITLSSEERETVIKIFKNIIETQTNKSIKLLNV